MDGWAAAMEDCLADRERARATIRQPEPWRAEVKAWDEVLAPLFELPNPMMLSACHELVSHVPMETIDADIRATLDHIAATAATAGDCP